VTAASLVVAAAVVATAGFAVGAKRSLDDALDDARPAHAPFVGLTQTRIGVGGDRLRVVLADESDERVQGLRERSDIGSYDGMLFVFDKPTDTAFTMSTVPVILDIGFYNARGRLVDRLRMEPCPDAEADCPLYQPDGEFTYALETLADGLPRGRLTG
jgi:hypothetical protein